MPKGVKRKKGAVRPGHGARCFICGMECGRGGSLKRHVEATHHVDYAIGYKRCFKGGDVTFAKCMSDPTGETIVQIRVLKIPPKQK
jgi:hypothetical protein